MTGSHLFTNDAIEKSAEISECGQFRWWLRRQWVFDSSVTEVCFVMLNPSTADDEKDDPTIRRCIAFAQAWGYGSLIVRNLYPFRATKPKDLKSAGFPTGGERGDRQLAEAVLRSDACVCAWGANARPERVTRALEIWESYPLWCLGTTKEGHPRHPLYVPGDQPMVPFQLGFEQ